MNLKKLIAFRAVLESNSITGAADKIGLTQSGVSRLITSLEQELDFPLFNRIKGRILKLPSAINKFKQIFGKNGNIKIEKNRNNFYLLANLEADEVILVSIKFNI